MCDIKNIKACKLLLLSLVLLFAVLPGELEARPRIANSDTNSVHSPTPIQEISQEDDQVVTQNLNQTNEEGNKQIENAEDKIQNKAGDVQNDNIETTTLLPVDVTSSDNIGIPFEFPSEKSNLFTILSADDFPILSRKLRGENLGYFENPIESTDLTYSHVPIEFPTQSNSDIQILHSKDHPIFTNFLANKNEESGLSLDLEEGSGNFAEKIYEQENKELITNKKLTNIEAKNVGTTTEPELITEIASQTAFESFREFIESNSENEQVEETENKSSIYTDELILPTNESDITDAMIKSQTKDRLQIFGDLFSQKHNTGTSTDEPNMDTTELVQIKLDNFFSTPLPEISSKLLTTIPTISEQHLLESKSTLVIHNIKDDIESLVEQNEEDYWDKKDNSLNGDVVGRTEEPVNFSKDSIKTTEIPKLNSPSFSTDQVRHERIFDNYEILGKGDNSEAFTSENLNSLNSEILGEEESSTVTEDLSSTPSMELIAVTTNLPDLGSPKNLLNERLDSINYLEEGSFKTNIGWPAEEEDVKFSEHTVTPKLNEEVPSAPTQKSTEITVSQDEDIQTTSIIDSLTEITASKKYPDNSTAEHTENSFSQTFESTTPLTLDDKQSDATTIENTAVMIELKNKDYHEISKTVEKIINTPKTKPLSEEIREESTEDLDSEYQIPLLHISVEPVLHPKEDIASIVDSTLEELEVKHSFKNSEEESMSREEILSNRNDFEGYLQNISENIKTETEQCCSPINEEQVKEVEIDEDKQDNKTIPITTPSNEEKVERSSEAAIENYENTQKIEDMIVPNSSTLQNLSTVKIGFKFDEVSDIIAEEETAEKRLKEDNNKHSKINTKHNSSHDNKDLFKDITTPRGKIDSFENNDDINEVLEPKLQPQKEPKVFAISKKFHSSEETSSSEEHLNRHTKKKVVHLNTPIENKSSSESVESYEISYLPSQKRFPFKTPYQGRAFSDASADFTEMLQPFRRISVEEADEYISTDHSVRKKPAALDSTSSPLIFAEETNTSFTEKEDSPSSKDEAKSTTLPSFTDMIVEAATLTTELNHEIESFRTSDQTTEGVFEETFAAIGSTIPTEVDKHSLGDALPTHDMKNTVATSDISLSAILMICVVGIIVVLALLVTTWYKIRNSGSTFDIQLEEQRHRKEQGSQTTSVSE